jgi:hypothetical protein
MMAWEDIKNFDDISAAISWIDVCN